jgi:hypothetical protein
MKQFRNKNAVIFIRTNDETKEEFLRAVKNEATDQNTLGEYLLYRGAKKINKQYDKSHHQANG